MNIFEVEAIQVTGSPDKGDVRLHITIPQSAVCAGVHSFVITKHESLEVLERFVLIGGDLSGQDLRAEVDLLRAELD